MYLSHYDLSKMPFQTSPDPKFLWLGEKHKEAFSILRYGTLQNYGFLLLTGDVGTGKTTLLNALINGLGDEVIHAFTPNPNLEVLEFFNFIAEDFDLNKRFDNKFEFLSCFRKFLLESATNNKKVLLIIDEAHQLSEELFEEIRLLSNIETQSTKLLNIFFVGQNEILDLLAKKEFRALRQRITLMYNIKPFSAEETREYICHRLRVAGTEKDLFAEKAVRKIYQFSKGYPRLINTICDRALLTGYAKDLTHITPSIIKECAAEFSLSAENRQGKPQRLSSPNGRGNKSKERLVRSLFLLALILLSGFVLMTTLNQTQLVNLVTSDGEGRERGKAVVPKNDSLNPEELNPAQLLAIPPSPRKEKPEAHFQSVTVISKKVVAPSNDTILESTAENKEAISIEDYHLIVPFPFDDNEISKESQSDLDDLVELITQNPEIKVIVKGYTDTVGGPAYNKKLSKFRANVVKTYLVGKGISAEIIASIGMGEENPLEPNATKEGRSVNRRVEVELRRGTE
jgi:general secretion pathway protein A